MQLNKYRASKRWLFYSVSCLLVGGILSLILVISRAPVINQFIDSSYFSKKSLVIHVTLTLGCWFFGYLVTLFNLLGSDRSERNGLGISILGVVIFVLGGFFIDGTPILSNYIPIIHNIPFIVGVSIFFAGVLISVLNKKLITSSRILCEDACDLTDEGSIIGIKTAVVVFILAMTMFVIAFFITPKNHDLFAYYEILFWSSGHLFQLSNIAALISVWQILFKKLSGRPLISKKLSCFLSGFLLTISIFSFGFLFNGTVHPLYYAGFTSLMRWGTWPTPTIVIILILFNLYKYRSHPGLNLNSYEIKGLLGSIGLLIFGFFLGAQIRGSSTLIPAHYHATIGSVTLSYMTMTYLLFNQFQISITSFKKFISAQLLMSGLGQFVFSFGFAFAGLNGLTRKVYGNEQIVKTTEQIIGLGIMGVGGAIAITGGFLFFVILYKALKLSKKTSL